MAEQVTTPRAEDLVSVGSRISWGAILAGTMVALALQFLLAVLGGAVGVSISDRVDPGNLRTAAVIWAIVTTCAAVFVGGMVTSQFTVGENKWEAVLYGIIMWALLFALLLGLGAAGSRHGFNAMMGLTQAPAPTTAGWEAGALAAGVPATEIEEWRRKSSATREQTQTPQTTQTQAQPSDEDVKKVAWYVFAGTWISLLAAGAGALVGAGPTFRLVVVEPTSRTTL